MRYLNRYWLYVMEPEPKVAWRMAIDNATPIYRLFKPAEMKRHAANLRIEVNGEMIDLYPFWFTHEDRKQYIMAAFEPSLKGSTKDVFNSFRTSYSFLTFF